MHSVPAGPQATLCLRLAFQLNKIEREVIGVPLAESVARCPAEEGEERYEHLIYHYHYSHVVKGASVIVTDLKELTGRIDEVEDPDVRAFLREWYYNIKREFCGRPEAQAAVLRKV